MSESDFTPDLRSVVAELRAQQRSFHNELGEVKQTVNELAVAVNRYMQTQGRAPWGVLSGWAAVVLAVGGLAAAPLWREQDQTGSRVGSVEARVATVEQTRWSRSDAEARHRETLAELRHVQDDLETDLDRLRTRVESHTRNGHPETVLAQVARVEAMLDEVRVRVLDLERARTAN